MSDVEQLRVAVDRLRPGEDRPALARALRALGEALRGGDSAAEALQCYRESVTLLEGEDDPRLLAHTLRHLADVYREQGQGEAGAGCCDRALGIYRDLETPPVELANALRSRALLHYDAGEAEPAADLWEEALELYRSSGIQTGVAECGGRLAVLAHRRGDSRAALAWVDRAAAAAEASGDRPTVAYILAVRGLLQKPPAKL